MRSCHRLEGFGAPWTRTGSCETIHIPSVIQMVPEGRREGKGSGCGEGWAQTLVRTIRTAVKFTTAMMAITGIGAHTSDIPSHSIAMMRNTRLSP